MRRTPLKAFRSAVLLRRRGDSGAPAVTPNRSILRLDRADLDIAEGYLSVIALESNVSDVRFGEEGHVAELALGDALLEVIAAEDVVKVLYAVDLMFALLRRDKQTYMIPLPDGLGGVKRLTGLGINRRLI